MAKHHEYRIPYHSQINTNEYLQKCDPRDVIAINSDRWISIEKLKKVLAEAFNYSNGLTSIIQYISSNSDIHSTKLWFHEGQQCEILKAGSPGWQKGKLKINVTLEFIPDEPEVEKSPLDDIRQAEINNYDIKIQTN